MRAECDTSHAGLTVSGYGYFMFGQIVRGYSEADNTPVTDTLSHAGQNLGDARLTVIERPNNWLTTKASLELQSYIYLDYLSSTAGAGGYYPTFNIRIPFAEGIMHWDAANANLFSALAPSVSSVTIESGLFQYSDNPETKDLGNYMFRSMARPMFVYTQDDYPWADMQGMRAEIGLLNDKVKLDGIVNFSSRYLPFHDLDIAATASYTPNKIISILGGVDFEHAVRFDGFTSDTVDRKYRDMKDEAVVIFDPKPLFGNWEGCTNPLLGGKLFNDEDLKIYGEAAVLGQRDSVIDDNPSDSIPKPIWFLGMPVQRMPMTLGFNIPTLRLLDYLSLEVEWWKDPYPDNWLGAFDNTAMQTGLEYIAGPGVEGLYLQNRVRWALSLDKSISKFEIKACAASDHVLYQAFKPDEEGGFEQTLRYHGNWQWWIELRYNL